MFGLITGSGFYDIPELEGRAVAEVATPFGAVELTTGTWAGVDVAFLPRHGAGHTVLPHEINYRANIWAFHEVQASAILATAVSGAIDPTLTPGALVLIDDFLNTTSGRERTFFSAFPGHGGDARLPAGLARHTDMTEPYSLHLRSLLRAAAEAETIEVVDGGVYGATNGPRFETKAEIRMLGLAGCTLVGMTGYPEVALANEIGIPYAAIGVVSNPACGLNTTDLTIEEIMATVDDAADPLYRLIAATIKSFDASAPS